MNNYRDIIKAPIITEKTANLSENLNRYTFSVDVKANKTQIKQAIEAIFNVKVLIQLTSNQRKKELDVMLVKLIELKKQS